MLHDKYDHDIEKDGMRTTGPHDAIDDGAVPGESFEIGNSTYAKLQRLAGKLNIEQRGIERVPENERTDTSLLNVGTMVRLRGPALEENTNGL